MLPTSSTGPTPGAGSGWYRTPAARRPGGPTGPARPAPHTPPTDDGLAFFTDVPSSPDAFTAPPPAQGSFYQPPGPEADPSLYGPMGSKPLEEEERPLLEELGIDFSKISARTLQILLPFRKFKAKPAAAGASQEEDDDADLAGPLVFCLLLGAFLLLRGKAHFGYIYGFGLVGCVGMWMVLNLMSDKDLDAAKIVSVLGYCLLPVVVLSAIGIVVDLRNGVGPIFATIAVLWCTATATRLFEEFFGMREQRYLVAYPIALLYSCFALITIF